MDKIMMPRWPIADGREEELVKEVLSGNNWWKNGGQQVKHFEREFSAYQKCKYGICVSNGTIAIEIALRALGISYGDEVIVPAFTFFSTISAVFAVGARPVIVDVDEDTFCLSKSQILNALSPKTKAIIVVHIAGNIAEMEEIVPVAKEYGLFIIEDAAHAQGSVKNGWMAGNLSDCATFSFQNAKLLTAGEGGAILSNNPNFIKSATIYSNCGRDENDTAYNHTYMAGNARLTEFQGAVLRAQLERYERQKQIRESNYQYLLELAAKVPQIQFQKNTVGMETHSRYMIMFFLENLRYNSRDIVKELKTFGIPANIAYKSLINIPVIEKMPKDAYRIVGMGETDCPLPVSHKIETQVICIPHNLLLGSTELIAMFFKILCQVITKYQ